MSTVQDEKGVGSSGNPAEYMHRYPAHVTPLQLAKEMFDSFLCFSLSTGGIALLLSISFFTLIFSVHTVSAQTDLPEQRPTARLAEGKTAAERTLGERATGEGSAEERNRVQFVQALSFSPVTGLPANVSVRTSDPRITTVRAMALLDGKLFAIPMNFSSSENMYRASFSTPSESMSYQFHFVMNDGGFWASDSYFANPRCREQKLERSLATASDFPEQGNLIRSSIELQKQALMAQYVVDQVHDLREALTSK